MRRAAARAPRCAAASVLAATAVVFSWNYLSRRNFVFGATHD